MEKESSPEGPKKVQGWEARTKGGEKSPFMKSGGGAKLQGERNVLGEKGDGGTRHFKGVEEK